MGPHEDVVVVGASLAGCATATLLARQGVSVTLLERSPDPDAYKRVCTHFIQPSAVPVMQRLGLEQAVAEAGGLRGSIDLWTRYGWSRPPAGAVPRGYNIRREVLDPLTRSAAIQTPGVRFRSGVRVDALVRDGRRTSGVEIRTADGGRESIPASLVIAADGRTSDVARMARVPTLRLPNKRFAYYTYFRGLRLASGSNSQLWFLDPEVAYAFPTDDDLTLVAYWPQRKRLHEVKANVDDEIRRRFAALAGGPRLDQAEQVGPWIGKLELPNVIRPASWRGVALVGDAAVGSDPLWGVGCGWALQSAGWLADSVAAVLADGGDPAVGLAAYRKRHAKEVGLSHLIMSEYSTGRHFLPPEKLIFAAAARDPATAIVVHRFAGRIDPPTRLFSPRTMVRAASVVAVKRKPAVAPLAPVRI